MILVINGSFGVGKTTVGQLLRQQIFSSRLYNPECTGSILVRLPAQFRLKGSGTDDFQDIDLWRKSVIYGTKIFRVFARNTVIVPMAFSRRDYFDEIISGMSNFDDQIIVYCLQAEMTTILKRLKKRGEKIESEEGNWLVRKAQECIEAHKDIHFGEPVNTEGVTAIEVANDILGRLQYRSKVRPVS
jgi:deoxyadenosine/deoxycytidine kinase